MAIGDVYKVSIEGLDENQLIVNIFWYKVFAEGVPASNVVDITNAWEADVKAKYLAIKPLSYSMTWIKARKMSSPIPPPNLPWGAVDGYDRAPLLPGGMAGGSGHPLSVAAVVRLRTSLFNRRGRGRLFIGKVPTPYTMNSALAVPINAALLAFSGQLNTVIDDTGAGHTAYSPVVVSRMDQAAYAIATTDWNPYLRSQRRREIGVGA
jgi:hypothetical protein